MLNTRALGLATILGTILQLAMVILGHSNASIAAMFAVGGMTISLIAGLAYTLFARGGRTSSLARGGAVAGGICALIGIVVSYALGDVPAPVIIFGTLSSAVTGALGGWVGKFMVRGAGVAAVVV